MSKLRKLKDDKWLMELKGKGLSNEEIANEVLRKHGVFIHPTSVGKYLKKRFLFAASYVRGQAQSQTQSIEILNLIKEDMLKIRKEIWELIKSLKEEGDKRGVGLEFERLSKHMARMNELLAQTTGVSFEQMDVISMSTSMGKMLKRLENEGYIVIKKKLPEEGVAET